MIGVDTTDVEAIAKFLPQLGIGRHKVKFNPQNLTGLTCLVQIGGHEVRTNHCYVQREGSIPVIQILDPASCRTEPINKFWIITGLRKALYIDQFGDVEATLETKIRPSLADVKYHLTRAGFQEGFVSLDLEVDITTHEITVFGVSYRILGNLISMSIPLSSENAPYWSEEEEAEIWLLIANLMSSPNPKVFQNFIFDTMYLRKYGIEAKGRIYDTMILNHWIEPELPKSLADLGRLWLTCDVWKGRDNWASNESLWLYNAKDAGYTLLILERQIERLKTENRIDFVENQLVPLSSEVLSVCSRGWNLDTNALGKVRTEFSTALVAVQQVLMAFTSDLLRPKVTYVERKGKPKIGVDYYRCVVSDSKRYERQELPEGLRKLTEIGVPVFEKKTEERTFNPLSPLHVKDILRSCGVIIPIKDGAESSNEDSLLKLIERKNVPLDVKDRFLKPLLDYRGLAKMISTYCDVLVDLDGVCRFSINIAGTVTSRFSSKQTPWETGFNAQNIPKSFRKVVIPFGQAGSNCIINLDFKQADPHMVAWLSGENEMLKILTDPKGDLHAHTASKIFGYDITQRPNYKESFERKLGKACNNGLNYGMQVNKFIETCRKQGLSLDNETAQKAYEGYFKAYPGIRKWQDSVRQQITQTRTLITPFGRKRYFFGYLDEKMINNALAYIPPTTVSDALNGLWLKFCQVNDDKNTTIIGQCHDSLTLEAPVTKVDEICSLLYALAKTVTFNVNGQTCNFPTDLEFGSNWGELKKWLP